MCKFMIKFKRAADKKVEAVGWKIKRRQGSCELIAAEEVEKAKRIWTGRQRSRGIPALLLNCCTVVPSLWPWEHCMLVPLPSNGRLRGQGSHTFCSLLDSAVALSSITDNQGAYTRFGHSQDVILMTHSVSDSFPVTYSVKQSARQP